MEAERGERTIAYKMVPIRKSEFGGQSGKEVCYWQADYRTHKLIRTAKSIINCPESTARKCHTNHSKSHKAFLYQKRQNPLLYVSFFGKMESAG